MYNVRRMSARPPQMAPCPRIRPASRFSGTMPAEAAIWRRHNVPGENFRKPSAIAQR